MSTPWNPASPSHGGTPHLRDVSEHRARAAVAAAPSANLQLLFSGAELILNFDRRKEYVRQAKQDLKEAASTGAGALRDKVGSLVPNPKQTLVAFVRDTFPMIEEVERLVEELLPDFVTELAGAAPYLGPCIQIARGSTNLVSAARGAIQRYEVEKTKVVVPVGAPLRAVEAMQEVIEREIARELLVGGRQIASGSASIAVTAASFGADYASPLIGTANALLSFGHNVYLHWRDNKEMKQANLLLKAPEGVSLHAFDASPILGCFLVGQVPTSDLLHEIATRIGSAPGWQHDIEKIATKYIHPLQCRAAKLIQSSRFYLRSPNEALFGTLQNKATLLPVDGGGPVALYNLYQNKKYNFGRQVSDAKHTVRNAVRGFGERLAQRAGLMRPPVQLP